MRASRFAASTVLVAFVLSNVPTPMYVVWQRQWGFSSGVLGVVFAGTYVAGIMATLLVAGRAADRYGRRRVMAVGATMALVASLTLLFTSGLWWLLSGRLFSGIAIGCTVTAGMAACVDLAPPRQRAAGSLLATSGLVCGAGLGPLYAGVIVQTTDAPQIPVFVIMSLLSGYGLLVSLSLPLPRPGDPSLPPGGSRRLLAWPRPPRGAGAVIVCGVSAAAPGMTAAAFIAGLAPSILADVLHRPSGLLAGGIVCAMFIAGTLAQLPLRNVRSRGQLTVSSLAVLVAMALVALSVTAFRSPWLFAAAALWCGVAQGTGQLAAVTLIALRIPAAARAKSNASLNLISYIPTAVLPISVGYLADRTGFSAAALVFAGLLLAASVAALILTTRLRTHLTAPSTPRSGHPEASVISEA